MALLQAYRVAAVGKLRDSKASRPAHASIQRLIVAAAILLASTLSSTASHAQAGGPFAGMAGVWSGGGTVTLDDGSTERLRCRATYAVGDGGAGLNLNLVCASDSYKFDLRSNVVSDRGAMSGTWSEASRGVGGNIEGRGGNGNFQVVANAPGFTANIGVTTRGAHQSVLITSAGSFRSAAISLSRR